jgi:hypothetical protein
MGSDRDDGWILKHDPEKWEPVFGKDHAQTTNWGGMTIHGKVIPLWRQHVRNAV